MKTFGRMGKAWTIALVCCSALLSRGVGVEQREPEEPVGAAGPYNG
ncbi:MAG: hypothetical protein K9M54_04080 [Kiritimatiellales bacterium]|nr:hypothetical protein [Kiritimatiellales bacterium]